MSNAGVRWSPPNRVPSTGKASDGLRPYGFLAAGPGGRRSGARSLRGVDSINPTRMAKWRSSKGAKNGRMECGQCSRSYWTGCGNTSGGIVLLHFAAERGHLRSPPPWGFPSGHENPLPLVPHRQRPGAGAPGCVDSFSISGDLRWQGRACGRPGGQPANGCPPSRVGGRNPGGHRYPQLLPTAGCL